MTSSSSNKEHTFTTLFQEACELQEQKQYKRAENIYSQLLVELPDVWLVHYNLGLLFFDQNKLSKALLEYQIAVNLSAPNNDLFYNLAICQKECGLIQQAIDSYNQALELEPDDIDSLYNLAGCYTLLDRFDDSIRYYHEVLKRDSAHQSTLNNLAYLYHKTGDKKNGIKYYSELLNINPEHYAAEHMLAALTGKTINSAPPSYIKDVFDQYSDHYEDSLINKLHYTLPGKLSKFARETSGHARFESILDLGCGTGLSGEAFKDYCSKIDGIDLSENMVAIAYQKNIYNNLMVCDLHEALKELSGNNYTLILAADVFTYLGELNDAFERVKNVASPDGLFYFSVENLNKDSSVFLLQESGRFAHSQKYILETALKNGWEPIQSVSVNLRKERDCWIEGMIYGFSKTKSHKE